MPNYLDPILNIQRPRRVFDADGQAYAEAIAADGAENMGNYYAENWLFATLRSRSVLSLIIDGFLRGHNNNDANRRKLISRGQGTFPAGTVTPSTGYITYSSNGYGSYVTALNAMGGVTTNGQGGIIDTVDSVPGDVTVPMGVQTGGGLNYILEIIRVGTDWYFRVGHEATAQFILARGSYTSGMIAWGRTSATNAGAYHYDGSTFNTIGTTTGLSGGGVSTHAMFTGCRNGAGSPIGYTNGRERLSLITNGASAAQFQTIMETFWAYYVLKGWV